MPREARYSSANCSERRSMPGVEPRCRRQQARVPGEQAALRDAGRCDVRAGRGVKTWA